MQRRRYSGGEVMSKSERVVSTEFGIAAMIAVVASVFLSGIMLALLTVKFESGWGDCSRTDKETGKPICSNQFKWEGWDAVPIQAIAGIVGSATSAYFVWKKSRLQPTSESSEPTDEETTP